jgi:gamma-D-glutamyl-L-lysine dipeptidyl-peptidase
MEVSYGVCRLSVVSVRKEQSHQSLQVTQLLFGDHYEVVQESTNHNWLRISVYFDGSSGWIERKQHHGISKEYFEQINTSDFKITTEVCSTILYKKSPISILMGSIVPISQSELFKMDEQFAFNGESKSLGQKRDFEFLKSISLKYLNVPEQEGGKSPFGIDGYGLIQMTYKIAGYPISRVVEDLVSHGKVVKDIRDAKRGDVVLVASRKQGKISAGLLMEDNKLLHADGRVRIDQLMEDGVLDLETKIYTHELKTIVRILND